MSPLLPVVLPPSAAVVAFVVGRRPHGRDDGASGGKRRASDSVVAVAVGAFVGVTVGYVLFVGVAWLAYGTVPSGYLLETYPPELHVAALAGNAVALGVATAAGAVVTDAAARFAESRPDS